MSDIIWKKVTYPGVRKDYYLVSEYGQVMNAVTGKILSPYYHGGYYRVNIAAEGRSSRGYSVLIHRLVAWEFVPNPNNYPIVDHIDGNKENTHYSNLEWVSYRENNLRARKLGLINDQGFEHSSSIFSEELAHSICQKLQEQWTVKQIFRWLMKDDTAKPHDNYPLFQFIHRLKHREGWENVTKYYSYPSIDDKKAGRWDKLPPGTGNNKYDEKFIREVCQYLEDGKSATEILEIYTGSPRQKDNRRIYDFIDGIRRKKCWTEISCEYNIDNNSTRKRETGWDQIIADWVDDGCSKKEIRNKLKAIDPNYTKLIGERANRMVDRYRRFKELQKNTPIIIKDEKDEK